MSELGVLVEEPASTDAVDDQLVRQLAARARSEGLRLTGEGGLLQHLTKVVVEAALDGEMDDHLGYARHDPAGRDGGNSRNGKRGKTLLTEAGPVNIEVPRDRDASFEPRIVAKRQRRLTGLDDLVISLSAKGLTHGEISAHLAEVFPHFVGGAPRRGGVQADHFHDHRPGVGRLGGVFRVDHRAQLLAAMEHQAHRGKVRSARLSRLLLRGIRNLPFRTVDRRAPAPSPGSACRTGTGLSEFLL